MFIPPINIGLSGAQLSERAGTKAVPPEKKVIPFESDSRVQGAEAMEYRQRTHLKDPAYSHRLYANDASFSGFF